VLREKRVVEAYVVMKGVMMREMVVQKQNRSRIYVKTLFAETVKNVIPRREIVQAPVRKEKPVMTALVKRVVRKDKSVVEKEIISGVAMPLIPVVRCKVSVV